MAKLKAEVIVLQVEHREEDNRIVTFSPINKEGEANVSNVLKVVCKGDKKDNFEEGERYILTIETAGKEATPPALTKKQQDEAAKKKAADVKKLNEAIEAKTKEFNAAAELAEQMKSDTNDKATANPDDETLAADIEATQAQVLKVEALELEVKALQDALDLLTK